MVTSVLLMLLLLPGDYMDLADFDCRFSIHEKMGDRLFDSTFTLCYTLSTSVEIVIYYQVWLNVACIVINVPAIVYLLKSNFTGKLG